MYDVICWLYGQFGRVALQVHFAEQVNNVLAAHGVAWDLGDDGRLHRVLPSAAQAQVEAAIHELGDARYAHALTLFHAARDAYDDRPRRDRDACANAFDAMEAVAQVRFNRPGETFGQIKNYLQKNSMFQPEMIDIFTGVNALRNHHFGHGTPFPLSRAEVDFVYVVCVSTILLFTRTPQMMRFCLHCNRAP